MSSKVDSNETGGELAMLEISRRKRNLKYRNDPEFEKAVLEFSIEKPAFVQLRVSNEL